MRKRNWILLIVSLVIILAFIFVLILSNKNKKLGFISDDSRQIALVQEIYKNLLDENIQEKINLTEDTSIYINFITYNHYVLSHESAIKDLLEDYITTEDSTKYTLSNEFNLKNLTLKVTLKRDDILDEKNYTYKLSTNKKENKIDYKLIDTEFIIE